MISRWIIVLLLAGVKFDAGRRVPTSREFMLDSLGTWTRFRESDTSIGGAGGLFPSSSRSYYNELYAMPVGCPVV